MLIGHIYLFQKTGLLMSITAQMTLDLWSWRCALHTT